MTKEELVNKCKKEITEMQEIIDSNPQMDQSLSTAFENLIKVNQGIIGDWE